MKNFILSQNFSNPYVTTSSKKHNLRVDSTGLEDSSLVNEGAVPMVESRPVSDLSDSLIRSKIIDNIKKEEILSGETLGGIMKFNADEDF